MIVFPYVPWLRYEEIRRKANSFLEKYHPSKTIPIPIEEIVEFGLELSIDPLPGLCNIDLNGFLYSDFSGIAVDDTIFGHVNPSRYRFTLAHEVGHLALHTQLYKEFNTKDIAGYLAFLRNLPQDILDRAEWQAYCFAGLVLVPAEPLEVTVKGVVKDVVEIASNLPNNQIDLTENINLLQDIVEKETAKVFGVSQAVISKRVGYDKLDLDHIIISTIKDTGL